MRALAARILGNLGYTVLEAGAGDEALRFAQAYLGDRRQGTGNFLGCHLATLPPCHLVTLSPLCARLARLGRRGSMLAMTAGVQPRVAEIV